MEVKPSIALHYEVTGEGEPLILCSGGFCDLHVWDDVLSELSGKFQVIRYDHRGIGGSEVIDDNDYSTEVLAQDLLKLMEALNLNKAHLVGHSMGGFIGQYFAAHYPERLMSLSLCSSLLCMNQLGHGFLDEMIASLNNQPDEILKQLPEIDAETQNVKTLLQQAHLCKKHDSRPYIQSIVTPTQIIAGDHEDVVLVEESERLAQAISSTKNVSYLDSNHMLQRERPAEFAQLIIDFVTQSK